jgi:hypothetical protein
VSATPFSTQNFPLLWVIQAGPRSNETEKMTQETGFTTQESAKLAAENGVQQFKLRTAWSWQNLEEAGSRSFLGTSSGNQPC